MSKSELEVVPGIGPSIARDLNKLGIIKVSDLAGRDPQAMYDTLCKLTHSHLGCVLYVFRCAVYYASHVTTPRS